MSEQDKRKTLSISKRTTANTDKPGEPRLRSGARARAAMTMQRLQQQPEASEDDKRTPRAGKTASKRSSSEPAARHPRGNKQQESSSSHASRSRSRPNANHDTQDTPRPARAQRERRGARFDNPDRQYPKKESTHSNARLSEIFKIFAPCPQGLEEVLSAELQALGYENVKIGRGGCHFQADWSGVLRINLYSRIATRILVQVAHAPVHHEDDIFELAYQTPWERWFGAEQTLRVDTSAIRSPMQSLQFCNLRAKDGICDRLRDREGERPSIDTVRPDARVHLFLDEQSATLYLDTSGESLFKRGWRHNKGEAPLRENLAAGILALSDWDPNQALMDPFCGSGTILIEAAWIALGAPPGIWRPFHFERLRNHDDRIWKDIKADARSRIATELEVPLVGYDLDPAAIQAAKANLDRSHLSESTVRFEVANAVDVMPVAETGWIVSNPPYGERLAGTDDAFWRDWSAHLKQNYAGWNVNLITSDLDLPSYMRLKPKRRTPLYNGALDCRLFSFEMVKAGYRKT